MAACKVSGALSAPFGQQTVEPDTKNRGLVAKSWLLWNLRTMPHGDDPDGPTCDAVEKPVRVHDDLAIRKLGEFGKDAT